MTPEERAEWLDLLDYAVLNREECDAVRAEVVAAIRDAVAAEREECAKLAYDMSVVPGNNPEGSPSRLIRCLDIAQAIRNRGKE